jgi:hypothetical protein
VVELCAMMRVLQRQAGVEAPASTAFDRGALIADQMRREVQPWR